jgi:hypothetical protein
VAALVGEILETSESNNWCWVPTKENFADEAIRGENRKLEAKIEF